ncbi:hypothetical protein FRX31_012004, partial [Thalictrum thalictroides]
MMPMQFCREEAKEIRLQSSQEKSYPSQLKYQIPLKVMAPGNGSRTRSSSQSVSSVQGSNNASSSSMPPRRRSITLNGQLGDLIK